jgi:hypothetical protein
VFGCAARVVYGGMCTWSQRETMSKGRKDKLEQYKQEGKERGLRQELPPKMSWSLLS